MIEKSQRAPQFYDARNCATNDTGTAIIALALARSAFKNRATSSDNHLLPTGYLTDGFLFLLDRDDSLRGSARD
jgi:hypothetical protein